LRSLRRHGLMAAHSGGNKRPLLYLPGRSWVSNSTSSTIAVNGSGTVRALNLAANAWARCVATDNHSRVMLKARVAPFS